MLQTDYMGNFSEFESLDVLDFNCRHIQCSCNKNIICGYYLWAVGSLSSSMVQGNAAILMQNDINIKVCIYLFLPFLNIYFHFFET